MRIVHLSDTHLFGDDTLHYGIVDTAAALQRVLDRADAVTGVDALVLSGDLSDDGTPASYRRLVRLVEPWAERHGATVVYAMGNHDDRAAFQQVLSTRFGAVTVGGVRILRLDSSVPGAGYGEIDDEQLTWLRGELAAASDAGSDVIIVLHHPPTAAYSPLLRALELQNPAELLDVCAGVGGDVGSMTGIPAVPASDTQPTVTTSTSPVRAILAGHYHHPVVTVERGIPVIVAPGIANTSDACPPSGHERATMGAGFAVIDVAVGARPGADSAAGAGTVADSAAGDAPATGPSSAAATPRPAPRVTFFTAPSPGDGAEIFDLPPDRVAEITATAGPQ